MSYELSFDQNDWYKYSIKGQRPHAMPWLLCDGCERPSTCIGETYAGVDPSRSVGTAFERPCRAAVAEGVAAHCEHDYSDGRLDLVVSVDASPGAGSGVAVFWRDVTIPARAVPRNANGCSPRSARRGRRPGRRTRPRPRSSRA